MADESTFKKAKNIALKLYGWLAVAVVVVLTACWFIFGKVVEETLFLEIAKWVLMGIGIYIILAVICYSPFMTYANRKASKKE